MKWYEDQVRREVESKEAEATKHAQQQEQLQASRDALQKHLAVTEAEFRLALQVISCLPCLLAPPHCLDCLRHLCHQHEQLLFPEAHCTLKRSD